MPSYSRYSHHARRALTHASLLVRRFHHPRVDTGHLLVGVMLTNGSIGYEVLNDLELKAEIASEHLEALTLPLDVPPESPANDAALDIALDLAADESHWLGHHYVGTEHLLLGITRTNIGNAADLLHRLDVPPDQVRRRVREAVSDGAQEYRLELARRNARLSELSRRVINAAEQMAISFDHPSVGLGHLLAVLRSERRAETSSLLRTCKLDNEALKRVIEQATSEALVSIEEVLQDAVEHAQKLGMHYTGTEHLLLGVLSHETGQQLLRDCGVDPDELRRLIEQELR